MWNLYVGHVANKSAGTLWYYYGLKANRGFDTSKGVTNKASGECTICHIERGVFGKLDIPLSRAEYMVYNAKKKPTEN